MSTGSILLLIGAIVVFLRAGYELYRLIFDVENLRNEYRQGVEEALPKGSLGQIGQLFLINSAFGLWLQRISMAIAVAGTLAIIIAIVTNCKCVFY
jgi:hypothetical protein